MVVVVVVLFLFVGEMEVGDGVEEGEVDGLLVLQPIGI
jgi:hypothetical protein|tara:strand:- start:14 stop:127 length:114 start_codon:yes stop_codon:yes gene_type:complete